MMQGKTAVIQNRNGKKICEIEPPYYWGLEGAWSDLSAVIKWVWFQAFSIAAEMNMCLKMSKEITEQSRFHCLSCGQTSIAPVFRWGRIHPPFRNSLIGQNDAGKGWGRAIHGFKCTDKKCTFYKVHIPIRVLIEIDEMPFSRPSSILYPEGSGCIIPNGEPYVLVASRDGGFTFKQL